MELGPVSMRSKLRAMSDQTPLGGASGKALSAAARRALEEAAARRAPDSDEAVPQEIGGSDGPDPTRFGDWEHKGRAIDF